MERISASDATDREFQRDRTITSMTNFSINSCIQDKEDKENDGDGSRVSLLDTVLVSSDNDEDVQDNIHVPREHNERERLLKEQTRQLQQTHTVRSRKEKGMTSTNTVLAHDEQANSDEENTSSEWESDSDTNEATLLSTKRGVRQKLFASDDENDEQKSSYKFNKKVKVNEEEKTLKNSSYKVYVAETPPGKVKERILECDEFTVVPETPRKKTEENDEPVPPTPKKRKRTRENKQHVNNEEYSSKAKENEQSLKEQKEQVLAKRKKHTHNEEEQQETEEKQQQAAKKKAKKRKKHHKDH